MDSEPNDITDCGPYGPTTTSDSASRSPGNGVVTTYAYDPASRLATLAHDAAGSAHDTAVDVDYNPASQITERTGTNFVYDWQLQEGDIP